MTQTLRLVADDHIWGVASAFSRLDGFDVDLRLLQNSAISRACLSDADILLTRSATRVNADLLAGTAVCFAATATIGDDHYDKAWLDEQGIAWANAAGSSTGSVLEYMLTVLLDLHVRGVMNIPASSIGIIGAGRIGSALADICRQLGMRVLLNDPPRARLEGDDAFVSLGAMLEQADVLSIHTPLIRSGVDQTVHLLSEQQLAAFRGRGIINAARGSCVENKALCDWLDQDAERFAVLDCWESEPAPLARLMQHAGVVMATPHIAGHSVEGKAANTQYIYRALCNYLGIPPRWNMFDVLPVVPEPVTVEVPGGESWALLHAAATTLYPISHDHAAMRSWGELDAADRAAAFSTYRRHYPARRAWQHASVRLPQAEPGCLKLAQAIGLKTA